MSEEMEIQSGQDQGKEISAEALEQFSEQIREATAQAAAARKSEGAVRQSDQAVATLLIQFLQTHQDAALAQMIVQALRQNTPAPLILATLAPLFPTISRKLPVVNVTFCPKNIWPIDHQTPILHWEKQMVASLEHSLAQFFEGYRTTKFTALARLWEYVYEHQYGNSPLSGGQVLGHLYDILPG